MNKLAFLELIQQASAISDQQTEELEKVAATFPYCQTAHLLLAKSAHDKGSMLSTQRLRRASAYATNRQVLKRLIYTSPAPAPVFEAPLAEETQIITSANPDGVAVPLPAAHQEEVLNLPDLEEVIYKETVVDELPETEIEEAATTIAETNTFETTAQVDEKTEVIPLYIAGKPQPAEDASKQTYDPEEGMYSELAKLLTINSLSPSYTDLLAQKADPVKPGTAANITGLQSQALYITPDSEDEEQSEALIEPETEIAPFRGYIAEDAFAAAEMMAGEEADATLDTAPVAHPEAGEVIYTFSEIDQMYADDALGYWMASSRMGEALQLKDEVTRQRPVAFHPELILEYTKTHVLEEKPHEQQAAALHHQYNNIDQFLKLNPRLKAMQSVKMKQEPQEDLSLRNSKIKKGIASESLANIFLNQGKVKKAIKIYEQLLLKYPEKKTYFAGQIEKLQNQS